MKPSKVLSSLKKGINNQEKYHLSLPCKGESDDGSVLYVVTDSHRREVKWIQNHLTGKIVRYIADLNTVLGRIEILVHDESIQLTVYHGRRIVCMQTITQNEITVE